MSTTNPDERDGRIGLMLRPVVFALAIAVQFLAPAIWLFVVLGIVEADPGFIVAYVLPWVAIGLAAMWVPSRRSTHILAAFILSYIGGLFLVIAVSQPDDLGLLTIPFVGLPYAVAVLLILLFLLGEEAMRRTRETGVDTLATVINAQVSGMVNYVQRQRLTLKFTDQQGVDRFFRVGRTGGGWSAGDTIPIRYDPARPWSKRAILIDGGAPSLFR
jgi:MFS family permease